MSVRSNTVITDTEDAATGGLLKFEMKGFGKYIIIVLLSEDKNKRELNFQDSLRTAQ